MGEEAATTSTGKAQDKNVVHVNIPPSGLESLKLYKQEIATYLRELPRLLEEGHAWRHALVKGDEVLSIWDTQGDAIQAGRDRFGLDPIYVKTIDPRDPERYALVKAQLGDECPF
jgi:asparagine synthetase B (glutamine-hydrolysing)